MEKESKQITNFGYYKDELVKLGRELAIVDGVPCRCCEVNCDGCIACDVNDVINWFLEPYRDSSCVLTRKERQFCELLEEGYIARDRDGWLYVYKQKPHKEQCSWYTNAMDDDYFDLTDVRDLIPLKLPFIKWEDEEPWSIEQLLKLKVVE